MDKGERGALAPHGAKTVNDSSLNKLAKQISVERLCVDILLIKILNKLTDANVFPWRFDKFRE